MQLPSCASFSDLSMDNVVIISQRDHRSIIETSISLFEKNRTAFSRAFLTRNIRTCLLAYHGALLATAEKAQNAAYGAAGKVDDLLRDLSQEGQDLTAKTASEYAKALREGMKTLYDAEKKDTSLPSPRPGAGCLEQGRPSEDRNASSSSRMWRTPMSAPATAC
jgi:DNA polymerase-3 subunit gamma/tau